MRISSIIPIVLFSLIILGSFILIQVLLPLEYAIIVSLPLFTLTLVYALGQIWSTLNEPTIYERAQMRTSDLGNTRGGRLGGRLQSARSAAGRAIRDRTRFVQREEPGLLLMDGTLVIPRDRLVLCPVDCTLIRETHRSVAIPLSVIARLDVFSAAQNPEQAVRFRFYLLGEGAKPLEIRAKRGCSREALLFRQLSHLSNFEINQRRAA